MVVGAGLIGFDRLFASSQEVFVLNGLPKPLKVRVDSGEPIEVPPNGKRMVQGAEGQHKIAVIEPAALAREEEFTVGGSVIGRWGGGQLNIVDPARSAVVVWEESVYAANARDQRGDFKIHAGEPFATYQHIDYKFQEFPNTLHVEGGSKSVTKHRVGLVKLDPVELLLTKPELLTGEARLDFLEAHLATAEKPAGILDYYWMAGAEQDQLGRCCNFLKKSLGARPIDIDWHRMYQTASDWSGKGESLTAEYDAMLTKEPDNPDLLYLRGRIEPFGVDSAKYYDRAIEKSPNHGFTWWSKAYLLSAAGRFEEALEAIDKAIAADSQRGELKSLRRGVLHALGRHDQVVKELRSSAPAGKDLELAQYPTLIHALAFAGNIDEAESTYTKFTQTVDREWPEDPLQLKLKSQLTLLLASKKYDELQAASQQITDSAERAAWNFCVQLNAGKLDEAASSNGSAPAMTRGLGALCLCVGWRNAHNDAQAQSSLKQAVELLAKGSRDEQIVAGWLREPPVDLAALLPKLTDLALEPDDKVIVLLALAGSGGQNREKLIDFATRLAVWPSGRKAFVESTLAGMR
jgi:tetratricopeptide (TPR) repeat protein